MANKESKELKNLKKQYEKIVLRIEQLNEEAFNLEKEIMYNQKQENII